MPAHASQFASIVETFGCGQKRATQLQRAKCTISSSSQMPNALNMLKASWMHSAQKGNNTVIVMNRPLGHLLLVWIVGHLLLAVRPSLQQQMQA